MDINKNANLNNFALRAICELGHPPVIYEKSTDNKQCVWFCGFPYKSEWDPDTGDMRKCWIRDSSIRCWNDLTSKISNCFFFLVFEGKLISN